MHRDNLDLGADVVTRSIEEVQGRAPDLQTSSVPQPAMASSVKQIAVIPAATAQSETKSSIPLRWQAPTPPVRLRGPPPARIENNGCD